MRVLQSDSAAQHFGKLEKNAFGPNPQPALKEKIPHHTFLYL